MTDSQSWYASEIQLHNYQIGHRITKQVIYKRAESAQAACEEMGWLLGECEWREVSDGRRGEIERR